MEVLPPSAQHGGMGSCLPFFCPAFPSSPQTPCPQLCSNFGGTQPWGIGAPSRAGASSSAFLPAEGWGPSRLSHLVSPLREMSCPRGGAEQCVGQLP